ncbi:uncharacterized protein LOC132708159 [Cylas formicarius]|uniref:uncharacterized protein LOC132708159 n=1 Tax=Cylas formicarius TaxID=197179 RepID=UPI00295896B6|nr:uncharacterized protein LOC132708159 [Cylas formicarius]
MLFTIVLLLGVSVVISLPLDTISDDTVIVYGAIPEYYRYFHPVRAAKVKRVLREIDGEEGDPLYSYGKLYSNHRYYDPYYDDAGVLRPGSDTGYMESYDSFPTVA